YSLVDELKLVLKESRVMYWAKSLFNYTYNYIDHHISTSPTPPPFETPHVNFVNASVALGYGQCRAVLPIYLLEECILFDNKEEFTKFIHNMDCVPSLNKDEYEYDLAVFLAFMQHV
ncbi:uncharacterized protein BJ212DRAFT_1207256, partial [Suillus subaureus]